MAPQNTTRYYDLDTLPDIWDDEDHQEWLVDNFIPKNAITIITGASGCGKSSVVLAMADAVAHGEPFLGHNTQLTPVLFVDRENPKYVYLERFKRFDIRKTDNIKFWGTWDPQQEPQTPDNLAIIEYTKKHKPLIIYDSLVAFAPESENDANESRKFTTLFRNLIGFGATVLIIHHVGKGENTKEYRGSSDIKANVDVAWLLTQKRALLKHMHLKNFKVREGIVENLDFALADTKFVPLSLEFILDTDPDWLKVESLIKTNPGIIQCKLFKALETMSQPKFRKILLAAETKGLLRITKGDNNASQYYWNSGLKTDPTE